MASEAYDRLIELLPREFRDEEGEPALSFAERMLLESAVTGNRLDCSQGRDEDDPERVIRSDVFEWMLYSDKARASIHERGVCFEHAIFRDKLDLIDLDFGKPIVFRGCRFDGDVILVGARLAHLSVRHATLGSPGSPVTFDADGLSVASSMRLNKSVMHGALRLVNATIGRKLDCEGAKLSNPGNTAFFGQGLRVGRDVLLCGGSPRRGSEGSGRFRAEGAVELVGAVIRGNLDCSKGDFKNPSGFALNARGARIEGDVYLDRESRFEGEARFESARCGALQLEESEFFRPTGSGRSDPRNRHDVPRYALNLHAARIRDYVSFVLRDRPSEISQASKIRGIVKLRHARIGQIFDSPDVWKSGAEHEVPVSLDGCTYDALGNHPESHNVAFRKAWLASGKNADPTFFAPQPYTQLAKVMHAAGHERQARAVLIERETQRLERTGSDLRWWERGWQRFIKHALAFGYQPQRMLIVLLVLLVIGTAVFSVGFKLDRFVPAVPFIYNSWTERDGVEVQRFGPPYDDLSTDRLEQYPGFMPLIYSLDTLVPIIDLHQETYWMPTGWVRWYMWVHIPLGWASTTLFVVSFTGVVRRD